MATQRLHHRDVYEPRQHRLPVATQGAASAAGAGGADEVDQRAVHVFQMTPADRQPRLIITSTVVSFVIVYAAGMTITKTFGLQWIPAVDATVVAATASFAMVLNSAQIPASRRPARGSHAMRLAKQGLVDVLGTASVTFIGAYVLLLPVVHLGVIPYFELAHLALSIACASFYGIQAYFKRGLVAFCPNCFTGQSFVSLRMLHDGRRACRGCSQLLRCDDKASMLLPAAQRE